MLAASKWAASPEITRHVNSMPHRRRLFVFTLSTLSFWRLLIWGNENVFARKCSNQGRRLVKISRKNVDWISRDPCGKIDRFVNPAVKSDQDPARAAADVFDRVTVALRYVADVSAVQEFRPKAAVRPKHGDAE